jgi:hypothetical protein
MTRPVKYVARTTVKAKLRALMNGTIAWDQTTS